MSTPQNIPPTLHPTELEIMILLQLHPQTCILNLISPSMISVHRLKWTDMKTGANERSIRLGQILSNAKEERSE